MINRRQLRGFPRLTRPRFIAILSESPPCSGRPPRPQKCVCSDSSQSRASMRRRRRYPGCTAVSGTRCELLREFDSVGTEKDRRRAPLFLERVNQLADALDQVAESEELFEVANATKPGKAHEAHGWWLRCAYFDTFCAPAHGSPLSCAARSHRCCCTIPVQTPAPVPSNKTPRHPARGRRDPGVRAKRLIHMGSEPSRRCMA